jgi:hypothetical protein
MSSTSPGKVKLAHVGVVAVGEEPAEAVDQVAEGGDRHQDAEGSGDVVRREHQVAQNEQVEAEEDERQIPLVLELVDRHQHLCIQLPGAEGAHGVAVGHKAYGDK